MPWVGESFDLSRLLVFHQSMAVIIAQRASRRNKCYLPGTCQPLKYANILSFFASLVPLPPLFKSSLVLSQFPLTTWWNSGSFSCANSHFLHWRLFSSFPFLLSREDQLSFSWLGNLCSSLFVWSLTLSGISLHLRSNPCLSRRTGLPRQWDFKITPQVSTAEIQLKPAFPKDQLPA